MTVATTFGILAPTFAAAAKKSSSSAPLLILVAIAAGFYFLILRPQQQKARKQREQVKVWELGDEVLTAGGLIGRIIDIDGDRVTLETSVGASFVVHKQYIIRKLEADSEVLDDDGDHAGDEYGDDVDEQYGDEAVDDETVVGDGEGDGGGSRSAEAENAEGTVPKKDRKARGGDEHDDAR